MQISFNHLENFSTFTILGNIFPDWNKKVILGFMLRLYNTTLSKLLVDPDVIQTSETTSKMVTKYQDKRMTVNKSCF